MQPQPALSSLWWSTPRCRTTAPSQWRRGLRGKSCRAAGSEVSPCHHGLEVDKLTGRWSVTQGFPGSKPIHPSSVEKSCASLHAVVVPVCAVCPWELAWRMPASACWAGTAASLCHGRETSERRQRSSPSAAREPLPTAAGCCQGLLRRVGTCGSALCGLEAP